MAKVYTQVYDISQPTEQRFWTPPFSNFKIGLKVTNKGEEVQGALSLKAGDTALSAEETEIDGFTIFPVSSTSAGSTVYTLSAEGVPETMKLVQVTTGSTVFEIDETGSGGGGTVDAYTKAQTDALLSAKADKDELSSYATEDELTAYATKDELTGYVENDDLTAYYTKSETSSAAEISNGLVSKVSGGAETGTTGTPAAITAVKSVYESDWATLSATADANTFYVVIPDPE